MVVCLVGFAASAHPGHVADSVQGVVRRGLGRHGMWLMWLGRGFTKKNGESTATGRRTRKKGTLTK